MLCRIISEDSDLTVPKDVNMDVNADDTVNIRDAIRILQLLSSGRITISEASAQKGDTVTVAVSINGYYPSAGGVVYIEYDPLLMPTAIRWNEDLADFCVYSTVDGYPSYFSWTTKDGKNQTIPDGTILAYIDFEVSEYVTSGSILEITPYASVLTNENGQEIDLTLVSGYITVTT